MVTFNDPLYSNQWHLTNLSASPIDLNISAVWEDYIGRGVRVGIQEGGAVQYSHADLAGNYNHAIDYDAPSNSGAIDPADFFQHATAVAGVIGASANNGIGGIGVAYGAQLASYQIASTINSNGSFSLTWSQLANSFYAAVANGMDVLNNSWGSSTIYGINFNSGALAGVGNAVEYAVSNGRGGLGINIVWSAGNSRGSPDWSNSTNFANSPYTIAVGAVGEDREYSYYSSPGANLLVSAPSNGGGRGITTTDLAGSPGYSTSDYTSGFGGTSSAAPKVSGIIALMVEANPALGYRDIQDILAYSARRAILETPSGSESDWVFNGADDWNGGGLHHNNDYGMGLVDATAAVRLAETWQAQSTRANETVATATSAATSQIVNGSALVSQSVNIATNVELEYVQLAVNMTHAYSGDVILRLVSPNGTVSTIKEGDGYYEGASVDWPGNTFLFSSTAFWGENSAGTWRLEVDDSYPSLDDGVFSGFSVTVRGTAADNDDTYIYTDEFVVYGGSDASRRTLSDASGRDILNAAAVTSAQSINLNPGSVSLIGGQWLTIAAATIIETAFGGDGADFLFGNSVDNLLEGGRGDDTLDGGAGCDTLKGGRGDDIYIVVDANDMLVEVSGQGYDTVRASIEYTLGANIEALELQGTGDLSGTGNSLDNVLRGNSGNNRLDGGAGADHMFGAQGDDVYIVDNAGDVVFEGASGGNDRVEASVNHALTDNVETLQLLGTGNLSGTGNGLDNLVTGNSGANVLRGLGGNDTLDGGAGADSLYGGDGDDTYIVDDTGDTIIETAAGGTDTARILVGAYALAANVENAFVDITADASLSGNGSDNLLTGNVGNDTLDGGSGRDTLRGGTGDDLLVSILHSNSVSLQNASFDKIAYAAGTGQAGASGWMTNKAGTWDPRDSSIATPEPDENVMFMTGAGASASQVLGETFDSNARYVFRFDHGTRNDYLGGEITAQIHAGSVLVGSVVSSAPENGWETRSLTVDGADYVTEDGGNITIEFLRTGNAEGQAQINGISLIKEYTPGTATRTSHIVTVANASFDEIAYAAGTGQAGASGWMTNKAGTWDPRDSSIATPEPDENVMFMTGAGASASQVLGETFDSNARYVFRFDHGTRNDYLGGEITAQIRAGSVLVGSVVSSAPTNGWETRTLTVDGADYVTEDGGNITIEFLRTGNAEGQAQINGISLIKEYTLGTATRTSHIVTVANASFDEIAYAAGTGQAGASGWMTNKAGTWDPRDSSIATPEPDENVMFMTGAGASASQVLGETFDSNARYVFRFDHGTRNDYLGGEITAQIHAGSVLVGSVVSSAPTNGWETRTLTVDGADYVTEDGGNITIEFLRTGNAEGQAQINSISLIKEYTLGTATRTSHIVTVANASFDEIAYAAGTGQAGASGWMTNKAGTWDPRDSSIATPEPDENVMFMTGAGASASQILTEALDAGTHYVLRFDHGTRSDYPGGEITAEIRAGGVLVGSLVSAPPTEGWETRTIIVDGADYAGQDGQFLTISFTRTGAPDGQAQLNNVTLTKETQPAADAGAAAVADTPDELYGEDGDDQLISGIGNDTLDGGNGNDTLDGGQGDDMLWGGADHDTFLFEKGDGLDVIADFSLIEDVIQFSGYDVGAFAALQAMFSDGGGDALITFDEANTLTLQGIASADLQEDNFLFA